LTGPRRHHVFERTSSAGSTEGGVHTLFDAPRGEAGRLPRWWLLTQRPRAIAAAVPAVSSAQRGATPLGFALIRPPLIRQRGTSTYQRQRERRSARWPGHAASKQRRTGQNHAHTGSWCSATPLGSAGPAAPPPVHLEP
jgi:hypothetical protein